MSKLAPHLDSWNDSMRKMPIEEIYGYSWGDPDSDNGGLGKYKTIKDELILPYVANKTVLEIGTLDGKWVQFLSSSRRVICVDLDKYGFERMSQRWPDFPLESYITKGSELSGVEEGTVDLVFTFDSLVRSPKAVIFDYLEEVHRVLSPDGVACLHLPCSDIPLSKEKGFTEISLEEYRNFVNFIGTRTFTLEEDLLRHGVVLKIGYHLEEE